MTALGRAMMARRNKTVQLESWQIDRLLALDDATLRRTLLALKKYPTYDDYSRLGRAAEEWEAARQAREDSMTEQQPDGRHTTQTPAVPDEDDDEAQEVAG